MGLSRTAFFLFIFYFFFIKSMSVLGHNPTKERSVVIQISQKIDKCFIIKAKAREMLDHLHIRHPPDHLIIHRSHEVDNGIFL